MRQIVQTAYSGIDSLQVQAASVPRLTPDGVLIKMAVVPVLPTDLKRETQAHATQETLAELPRVIGVGGVGVVIAVGAKRDPALLHQRVLVMNPAGSYAEIILSENPNFVFPLPTTVDNCSAATLVAGPGVAMTLKTIIDASLADQVVITGSNSVIGLYLFQLLTTSRPIYPLVSEASQSYFLQRAPQLKPFTTNELLELPGETLVIDIAGSRSLIHEVSSHLASIQVVSLAIMSNIGQLPVHFVHEHFDDTQYRQFIRLMGCGKLMAPIDRVFPIAQVQEAQHYIQRTHSRGRLLLTFDEEN